MNDLLKPATSELANHYRFSMEQYDQMVEAGILGKYDRVELIRGHIREKQRQSPLHSATRSLIGSSLSSTINKFAHCTSVTRIRLTNSYPEPDLAVLKNRDDSYSCSFPIAEETILIIEVADTSLEFDRTIKLPLYAENGIVEYWIVNLLENVIEIYRSPQSNGTYAETRIVQGGESLDIVELPGVTFQCDQFLMRRS